VTIDLLKSKAREGLKILHPLPRVDEIDFSVDASPYQAYYLQARLGVDVRIALLHLVLAG
ncbi:MAG: aspartate carbamoyltransferase, partial [Aeropyrum sp.]|nr:aspartate carbamoyltransferase [Aeropyrum sp.]